MSGSGRRFRDRALVALFALVVLVGTLAARRADAQMDAGLDTLVAHAAEGDAVSREEARRTLAAMGDAALPALLEAAKLGASDDLRAWAATELEVRGKRIPSDAVQTADPTLLAGVLRAFGKTRDPDALGVVLAFVDAENPDVREAARGALEEYGDIALAPLREAYTHATNRPPDAELSAERLRSELFAAHDRARLSDVYALLEDGLARADAGDLGAAKAAFDAVLAREPLLDRRSEMAAGYALWAKQQTDAPREERVAALREALRLARDESMRSMIESALLADEGEMLLARGIADRALFERALTLDPSNEEARAGLARIDDVTTSREQRARRIAVAGVLATLGLAGALAYARRRRRA
jgi:hypothetical protein